MPGPRVELPWPWPLAGLPTPRLGTDAFGLLGVPGSACAMAGVSQTTVTVVAAVAARPRRAGTRFGWRRLPMRTP
ncbi:hypothetical protein ACFQX7_18300 [Luedemannella flava]